VDMQQGEKGKTSEKLSHTQEFYDVSEITLQSTWIEKSKHWVTHIFLESETSTHRITTHKSNGILIYDAAQYTGDVGTNKETGIETLFVRRMPPRS